MNRVGYADFVAGIGVVVVCQVDMEADGDSARTLKLLGGKDLPAHTLNPKGETTDRIETGDGP